MRVNGDSLPSRPLPQMMHEKARSKPTGTNPGPSSAGVVSDVTHWLLKACGRCGGDLFFEYGEGPTCLDCGFDGPTSKGQATKVPREGRSSHRTHGHE